MGLLFIAKISATLITAYLFLGMLVAFGLGRMLRKRLSLDESGSTTGMIETTLLGLFGFILAFSFSMSGNRYDYIRNVYIEESNAIGTAILRSDLYSDSVRNIFRSNFKEYLEERMALYTDVLDSAKINASLTRMDQVSKRLWKLAMDESTRPNMLIPSNQMIPALNDMFDVGSKRHVLLKQTIPDLIIYMLLILALTSSFLAGFSISIVRKKEWIIVSCFILFTSLITYITLDLGRPMRGVIKANVSQQAISDLRKMLD